MVVQIYRTRHPVLLFIREVKIFLSWFHNINILMHLWYSSRVNIHKNVSARMSLAEFLRMLASYWRVHNYCMSAKILASVFYLAAWHACTSALLSSANKCKGIAKYALIYSPIHFKGQYSMHK